MSLYIGIDPGKTGGIACIETTSLQADDRIDAFKLSETPHDIGEWLIQKIKIRRPIHAMIERVSSRPGQGVASMFSFGRSLGFLEGLLTGTLVPYEYVSPLKWQRAMGCLTGGDKNVSKAAAQRLWPHYKITHANADALLIAEYCRRTVVQRS